MNTSVVLICSPSKTCHFLGFFYRKKLDYFSLIGARHDNGGVAALVSVCYITYVPPILNPYIIRRLVNEVVMLIMFIKTIETGLLKVRCFLALYLSQVDVLVVESYV